MNFNQVLRNISLPRELAQNTRLVQEILETVKREAWRTGRMNIPGFITLVVKTHAKRAVRNPQTMEWMKVPKRRVMKARVASKWRTK